MAHVQAVKDTKEMREAVEAVQGDRVKLSLRMSQSRPLYEAFQALRDSDSWESLTGAQKRIVESELRDFVLGGVALEGEVRIVLAFRVVQSCDDRPDASYLALHGFVAHVQ